MANEINAVAGQLWGVPVGQVYTAGPGIKIDNVNKTVRTDETVLWEGTITGENATASLIESPTNFERLRVYWYDNDGVSTYSCFETPTDGFSSTVTVIKLGSVHAVANHWKGLYATLTNVGLFTIVQCSEKYILSTAAWTTGKNFSVAKIVGINRIQSA